MTERTFDVPRNPSACPFCALPNGRIAWSSPLTLAIRDAYPLSEGHILILPRRHAASWTDLTADEQSALVAAINSARALITERHKPDAFNIGFNDGPAAGQTVMHFHIHVIPRYAGDVPDPRGGVRWVLPDKAAYWTDSDP